MTSSDDDERRGDKSRERKKRKKKESHRYEDEDDDYELERHRKKKARKRKEREERDNRRDQQHDSAEGDSVSDYYGDDPRDRKRRKEKKKKRKKKKKHKKESKQEKKARTDSDDEEGSGLERNYLFGDALHDLLEHYPALSSDLPVILIRMAGGTSFNLQQIPDRSVANRLERVFQSFATFGVEKDDHGSWMWKLPPCFSGAGSNERVLLQIARTLLDQIGLTMDAMETYENRKPSAGAASRAIEESNGEVDKTEVNTHIQKQTLGLLDLFGNTDSSLAKQLGDLCNMILQGESVSVEGIPNEKLRDALEQLFDIAGLEKSEMEEDSDDEEKSVDGEDEPMFGYGLPESGIELAKSRLNEIFNVCKRKHTKSERSNRSLKGPLPQNMAHHYAASHQAEEGDEEGPAPAGSIEARTRGPSLPPSLVSSMAEDRKRELEELGGTGVATASKSTGEREEWMLEPGQHDFLQGLKTGILKNRNFENKKSASTSREVPDTPMDPSVKAQVDSILQIHSEARGPSLVEQHRAKKAAEKAQSTKEGEASFGWNRERDLDSGRKVDKESLRMLLGRAGTELQDKFQGGLSRGQ